MRKKFLLLFFLMIIFPFSAQAHTALLSSTPSEGQNVVEGLTEVELVFDTKIQEGSTMSIEGELASFEFKDIMTKKNVMMGSFDKTLPSGSYRILWNIIGEDGHPVEGQVTFGMSIEAEEKAESVTTSVVDGVESATKKNLAELETEENNSITMSILLVLAAVLTIYGIYKLGLKKT